MGEIRFAADAPVGIAGRRGTVATFLAESDIRALLRSGASESLKGKLCTSPQLFAPWGAGRGGIVESELGGSQCFECGLF